MGEFGVMNVEIESLKLFPDKFSRRGFFVTSLGMGFTLAAGPLQAQTIIHTDDAGLMAGEVKIQTNDGVIPGYHAMPAKGKKFHTVLVIQEIFGVHEHIKDMCRRFAKLGYFAVAPELYARVGDVSKLTDIKDVLAIANKAPEAQTMKDLDATVAWAKSTGMADTGPLGVTGWCRGGHYTWRYAEHNPRVRAAVAWYGPLEGAKSDAAPVYVIDDIAKLKAPVLGLYGKEDQSIPLDTIERLKAAAAKAHKKVEFVVYDGAPHGFNADYRPSYRKEAADDGWKRLQAWFKKNGV
jgi:carboxymethylenebutenolidase